MNRVIFSFAFLCFIKCSVGQKYLSYVCHSFADYKIFRDLNPNCYYSGDVLGSFENIAQSYGYNTKAYEVITEDQYVLTLFRISPIRSTSVGSPVLLAHGSFVASTTYTLVGNHSLPFLLADQGYDVWLSNFRGTSYSDKHKYLNVHEKQFWDFTFHEYGKYDLKANIDFITGTTNQKVIYMGWSIGARAYYVYNILHPEEALQKVRVSISLAPTVYVYLMKTPLLNIIELIPYSILTGTLNTLFPGGVFYMKSPTIVSLILHFCLDAPSQVLLCEFIKDILTGFDPQQEEPEAFPVLIAQSTEATALKMAYHTVQMSKSRKFQQFDYGKAMNLMRYGTQDPPIYNLSLINLPHYIIYGPNDFLSPEDNAMLVYKQLPEVAKPFGEPYRVPNEKFCHTDMVAAKDVIPLLYDHILEFLKVNQALFNN